MSAAANPYALGGSIALDIISGFHQAEIIRGNARLNKDIADMNSEFAMVDSYNAELEGKSEEARYQTVIDQTESVQKAVYAAQNIDANFGTAAEVVAESKVNAALNKIDIENQAHARALGYKQQARQYQFQGKLQEADSKSQAAQAIAKGIISGAKSATGYFKKGG